jgi:hypothetical protein
LRSEGAALAPAFLFHDSYDYLIKKWNGLPG